MVDNCMCAQCGKTGQCVEVEGHWICRQCYSDIILDVRDGNPWQSSLYKYCPDHCDLFHEGCPVCERNSQRHYGKPVVDAKKEMDVRITTFNDVDEMSHYMKVGEGGQTADIFCAEFPGLEIHLDKTDREMPAVMSKGGWISGYGEALESKTLWKVGAERYDLTQGEVAWLQLQEDQIAKFFGCEGEPR